jgi:hypothetical protein
MVHFALKLPCHHDDGDLQKNLQLLLSLWPEQKIAFNVIAIDRILVCSNILIHGNLSYLPRQFPKTSIRRVLPINE